MLAFTTLCHTVLFSGIKDIDYSRSVYLTLGLLDEDDEKMRLYFLSKDSKDLTAVERTHFTLLNKLIYHRVYDLAGYESDDKDVIKTQDAHPYVGIYRPFCFCSVTNFGIPRSVVGI